MNDTPLLSKPVLPRMSLADSVYETLLEAIIGGQLKRGVELNSVTLSEQLQVSRTPVQEAIRRLEADGLVVNPLGKKARVAKFTAKDVREVYEMRIVLESTAAALAAKHISDDAVHKLRAEADALAESTDDLTWSSRAIDYDIRFHQVLAQASNNDRLRDDIGRYRLLVRGFCRMTGSGENLRAALNEHLTILAAIEARDGKSAGRAMRHHIEQRLRTVLSAFQEEDN